MATNGGLLSLASFSRCPASLQWALVNNTPQIFDTYIDSILDYQMSCAGPPPLPPRLKGERGKLSLRASLRFQGLNFGFTNFPKIHLENFQFLTPFLTWQSAWWRGAGAGGGDGSEAALISYRNCPDSGRFEFAPRMAIVRKKTDVKTMPLFITKA